MTIRILLFAAARDALKQPILSVELPVDSTVADLRVALKQYPQLTNLVDRCRIAVNQQFAEDDVVLHLADEVAVIPPVSGG